MILMMAALLAFDPGPEDWRTPSSSPSSLSVEPRLGARFGLSTFEGTLLAGAGVSLGARLDLSRDWTFSASVLQERMRGEDDKMLDPTLDPLCAIVDPLAALDPNNPCWSARTHQIRHDSLERTALLLSFGRKLTDSPTMRTDLNFSLGASRNVAKRYEDIVHDGILVSHQQESSRDWTVPLALELEFCWKLLPALEISAGPRMGGEAMTGYHGAGRGIFYFGLDAGVSVRF